MFFEEDDKKFAGAFVKDPVIGYHESVQVIDFASLYPSIMISWNMSPDTKIRPEYQHNISPVNIARSPATGVEFRTDRDGMIPMALNYLIEERGLYKKKQKEYEVGSPEWKTAKNQSTAIKVVANSIYGLTGSPFSRYHDREIAESVTLTGQYLIRKVIEYTEELGYQVIGADTDSAFIKATEDETHKIVKKINDNLIPKLLTDSGCQIVKVSMDFDKGYRNLLIQAKKRYAGKLSLHKGKPAPDDMDPAIKGLEIQRSDQIRLAQRKQMEFIKLLLDPNCDHVSIENKLRELADWFLNKENKMKRDDIEIAQTVSKDPDLYDVPTAAVKVAKKLQEEGREFFVGMKIPYIVIRSPVSKTSETIDPIHADDFDGYKFDRMYYWKNKLLPCISRLVEVRFPDVDFRELSTLKKSPNQFTLELDSPQKQLPKPGKKIDKQVSKKYVVRIDDSANEKDIKILSSIAKSCKPGLHSLEILFTTEKFRVTIDTGLNIDKSFKEKFKIYFPDNQLSVEKNII